MAYKLLVFSILTIFGFSYSDKYGGELYEDGKNARNAALGGLSISYSDGCNPVLFRNKQIPSIHFSHKNKYGNLAHVTTFSYFYPEKKYPIYIGFTNRAIDHIPDTRSAWADNNGNSIPESGEINYLNIYNIVQQEIGIQLSTIRFWGPYTLGFNLKPSFTSLSEYKSYSLSADVAAMLQPLDKLDLTLRLEDIIGIKYWDSGTMETIAPLIIGGIYCRLSTFIVGLESGSRIEKNTPLHYHIGIEYEEKEQLYFRIGTSHSSMITAGIGLKLSLLDFDYAYLQPAAETPFQETHVLSLGINLDDLKKIKGKIKP